MKKIKILILLVTIFSICSSLNARCIVRVSIWAGGYWRHFYGFVDGDCENFLAETCLDPRSIRCIDLSKVSAGGGNVIQYNPKTKLAAIKVGNETLDLLTDEAQAKLNDLLKNSKLTKKKIGNKDLELACNKNMGQVSQERINKISKEERITIKTIN